jgi:hypothetical protein
MQSDPRFAAIRALGGDRYAAFLAAGYREWYAGHAPKSTPFLLQRGIRDADGTRLYFVHAWAYDRSDYLPERPFGLAFDAQFNGHADQSPTFNVELFDHGQGPADVEAFFARLYAAMGCEPYGD